MRMDHFVALTPKGARRTRADRLAAECVEIRTGDGCYHKRPVFFGPADYAAVNRDMRYERIMSNDASATRRDTRNRQCELVITPRFAPALKAAETLTSAQLRRSATIGCSARLPAKPLCLTPIGPPCLATCDSPFGGMPLD